MPIRTASTRTFQPENDAGRRRPAHREFEAAARCLVLGLWAVLLMTGPAGAQAQSAGVEGDPAAIREAALRYVHAVYDGDEERLERSVHPALSRRIVRRRSRGDTVQHTGAFALVEQSKRVRQTPLPEDLRAVQLQILDAYAGAASVRVSTSHWVEYLHLARIDGRWQVLNVLWEMRAPAP